MKFDTSRALRVVEELGDPRFAGPDGEEAEAGYIAEQLAPTGWQVYRRKVVASGFPRLAVSWISWLGFGVLITLAMTIVWTFGNRRPSQFLGIPLLLLGLLYFYLALYRGFQFGWNLPPERTASLVIVRLPSERPPSCRVVLQTALGRLSLRRRERSRWQLLALAVVLLLLLIDVATVSSFAPVPQRFFPASGHSERSLSVILLLVLWVLVLGRISREIADDRSGWPLDLADRTGIGVLLEMARTWSPLRSQNVEILFAATGGQAYDFAGARSLGGWLQAESREIPTLLLIWFAPGIGREFTIVSHECRDLAFRAAKSLWLPHSPPPVLFRSVDLWPADRSHRDFIALFSARYLDQSPKKDVIDPATLSHTAQLVTEIAMRWIKSQQTPPDS